MTLDSTLYYKKYRQLI